MDLRVCIHFCLCSSCQIISSFYHNKHVISPKHRSLQFFGSFGKQKMRLNCKIADSREWINLIRVFMADVNYLLDFKYLN